MNEPAREDPRSAPILELDDHTVCKACRHGLVLFDPRDTHVGRALDLYGEWGEQELKLLRAVCAPGSTVVDVGAFLGTHTLALARHVGPGGRVIAFEPQRLPFQKLCANLALNGLRNVEVWQAAAGTEPGWAWVPDGPPGEDAHNQGSTRVSERPGDRASGRAVPRMRIDDLELPDVAVMKIDAEGMELDVLRGAERTLRAHGPVLYVENNDAERSGPLVEHLLGLGYSLHWHFSPFFSADNWFGRAEDVFGGMVDANMLCVRGDIGTGLPSVQGPGDTAEAALARWRAGRGAPSR